MRLFLEPRSFFRSFYWLMPLAIALLLIILASQAFKATAQPERGTSTAAINQPEAALALNLSSFASGLTEPVGIGNAGDRRLFVLEKDGLIKIIRSNGDVEPVPFLDITGRVDSSANEGGLLGLAFHPDYANNGAFFVNYTAFISNTLRTRISRFNVTGDPDVADPGSEDVLLTVDQPASNHNAGHILFGPDGFLYIPLGDGGSGGALAQDPTTVLGKILRIDVNSNASEVADCKGFGSGNYTIPSDNPGVAGAITDCDEIWASGLRNPWQSSFDSETGDLYIGDVGQVSWEEIDFQPAGSTGGENYGWPCYEANATYNTNGCGPKATYTFPIFEYDRDDGRTVTGGYVYRGNKYPAMIGRYIFADYGSSNFWDLDPDGSGGWTPTMHNPLPAPWSYSALGESCDGELYVANINNGTIYHIWDSSMAPATVDKGQAPHNLMPADFVPSSWQYLPIVSSINSPC